MCLIHWFNPENDLALAADTANYTPKKAALVMQRSGANLPLWYGASGDQLLCYGINRQWYESMCDTFGIGVKIFDHEPKSGQQPSPWGWSRYARRFFMDEGFDENALPTLQQIETMRQLSHRRTAKAIAQILKEKLPDLPIGDPAIELADYEQAETWLRSHLDSYVKHPWSGSGRGVMSTRVAGLTAALKFADDAIRCQGCVMLEKAYAKVVDFAKIYECINGDCRDLGTSVFNTDEHNTYAGNVIATERRRASMVERHIPDGALASISQTLKEIIKEIIAPHYTGILGVDMLADDSGTVAVVEVNLRKTMGYVANMFSDKFLTEGAEGTMRILPTKDALPLTPIIEDHKLCAGALHLNQPNTPLTFEIKIK